MIQRIILVAILFVLGCQSTSQNTGLPHSLTINVVHDPEIRAYLNTIKDAFLNTQPKLQDGTTLSIELKNEAGLSAAKKIANGELKTDGWIAPSSSHINYTNTHLRNLGAKQIECVQLFATPVVFATYFKSVERFGATGHEFSWNEFYENSFVKQRESSPNKIAPMYTHADPELSSTGMEALIQLAYLASSRPERTLNLNLLKSEQFQKTLHDYENFVSGYSTSENFLLDQIVNSRTNRLRFAITTEQQVATFNYVRAKSDPEIVALYAREGSYWKDYSLCTSDADWVSPAARAGLAQFADFLRSENAQTTARRAGFRPRGSQSAAPDVAPLNSQYGADTSLPSASFPDISGDVIEHMLTNWPTLKRPGATIVVLDTSGSMEGESLGIGVDYFRNLFARLPAADLKALLTFSSEPHLECQFTTDSSKVIPFLDQLHGTGGSALYDSIKAAIDLLTDPAMNNYRKNILVYTDGEDKNSKASLGFITDLIGNKFSRYDINLSIIAITHEGGDYSDLEKIAAAAGGLLKTGEVASVPSFFNEVFRNL